MPVTKIMVEMLDSHITLEALHLACAMARDLRAIVVLIEMIPVQYPGYLGTEFGNWNRADRQDEERLCYDVACQYGVEFRAQPFQCAMLPEAVADAAEYVDAKIVFANVPDRVIPFWRRYQTWVLRRRLAGQGRELYLPQCDGADTRGCHFVWVSPAHR